MTTRSRTNTPASNTTEWKIKECFINKQLRYVFVCLTQEQDEKSRGITASGTFIEKSTHTSTIPTLATQFTYIICIACILDCMPSTVVL